MANGVCKKMKFKNIFFFGSFNPFHQGHQSLLQAVEQQIAFDNLNVIVSPQNPFKVTTPLASFEARYAMASLALKASPKLRVLDIEKSLAQPSYTIDTLRALAVTPGENGLLLGEDNLADFYDWKEPRELLKYCQLIVYPRAGAKRFSPELEPHLTWLRGNFFDISATDIREKIHDQAFLEKHLSKEVLTYIQANHLYRT